MAPLRRGETIQLNTTEHTRAYVRVTSDASVVVAFNNSPQPQTVRLTLPATLAGHSRWLDRLAADLAVPMVDGVLSLHLPPRSAALLTPDSPAMFSEKEKTQTGSAVR